jgi:uncharacterized membrane protein (DUF485 family)
MSSPTPAHDDVVHSESFLHTLMRRQLKLSVACAAAFLVGLIGLPLLNYYAPALMATRVAGFTLSWLLLGVLCFPLVWAISYYFIRRSIWLEEDEVAQVKRERGGTTHEPAARARSPRRASIPGSSASRSSPWSVTVWMGFRSAKTSKTASDFLRRGPLGFGRLERLRHLRRIPLRRLLHGRGRHGDVHRATTRCGIPCVTPAATCSYCSSSPARCVASAPTRFPISPRAGLIRRSSARSPSASCCSSVSSTRCRR